MNFLNNIINIIFPRFKVYRGYKFIRENNKEKILFNLKDEFTSYKFKNIRKKNLFFNDIDTNFELIVRQFYLRKLTGYIFNKVILKSIGSKNSLILYPMPYAWLKILKKNNLNISIIFSCLLWFLLCLFYFLKGNIYFIKTLFKGLINIKILSNNINDYVYFYKLSSNNLPLNGKKKFDIINWYIDWKNNTPNEKKYKNIKHDVKVKNIEITDYNLTYSPEIIDSRFTFFGITKYIFKFIFLFIFVTFNLIIGRIYFLFLFEELVKLINVESKSKKFLAKEYYFNSSDWIYKPLWSYHVEKKGFKIYFYFYSANYEKYQFIFKDYWPVVTWNNFLVWDFYQKKFFESLILNPKLKYHIVNPIYFSDIDADVDIPENSIGVFTDQPQRSTIYSFLALPDDYLTPNTYIKFISDVDYLLKKNNLRTIHKIKRNIGSAAHPKYINFIKKYSKDNNFIEINPDISAFKIIKKCKAVISSPFTSTALVARYLNIPSVYYDPTGTVKEYEKAAHDIKVVYSLKELEEWLLKCIVEK